MIVAYTLACRAVSCVCMRGDANTRKAPLTYTLKPTPTPTHIHPPTHTHLCPPIQAPTHACTHARTHPNTVGCTQMGFTGAAAGTGYGGMALPTAGMPSMPASTAPADIGTAAGKSCDPLLPPVPLVLFHLWLPSIPLPSPLVHSPLFWLVWMFAHTGALCTSAATPPQTIARQNTPPVNKTPRMDVHA